jgi:hypothetical protein
MRSRPISCCAKKALERLRCPYAIKDKRGNVVTNLCF